MNNEHGRSNSNITELDETNVDAVLDVVLLVEDTVKDAVPILPMDIMDPLSSLEEGVYDESSNVSTASDESWRKRKKN
jgi:hypothetical protein